MEDALWAGDLDSHERSMRVFANASGMAVCAVDYHRIPEHRYPVQKNAVLTAIAWLRSEGGEYGLDTTCLVLWGESAGATLATTLRLAEKLAAAGVPCS